jgi:hypothetical protein
MIVYNEQRRPVELGESVGRGGEATVYRLAGQAGWLAKIYEPEPRPNYASKLGWMVDHPPANPTSSYNHASLAWPDGLFYDARGRLLGYRMPYIDHGAQLLEVFNPRRRAEVLPLFNRRYLHRTAHNLAAALSALHHSGYVAGDINESNVLVTPQALVTLIDTDSFQVREERNQVEILYPCPVGKPEYTPPELQGKTLGDVAREPDHDAFGLAALIFQLLMEGSHPFRAQWLGQGDPPPLEKRIAQGAYPYVSAPGQHVAPPRSGPALHTLHPWLVELFRRCFVDGHNAPRWRPGPDLWARAIQEAEALLVCCAEGHFYSSHLSACPYCAAASRRPQPAPVSAGPARERAHPRPRAAPPAGSPRPAAAGTPPAAAPQPVSSRTGAAGAGTAAGAGAAVSSAPPSGGASSSIPFWRRSPGGFAARVAGWPGPPIHAAAPAGAGSPVGGPASVLSGRPWMRPGAMRGWAGRMLSLSLMVGGGQGALAGALAAAAVALLNWSAAGPLDWDVLVAVAGLAGGLLRGWQPGYRFANLVDRYVGWKRFWQGIGIVIGGLIGLAFGLIFVWAIFPVILGLVLGAQSGMYVGGKLWQAGKTLGWEKILAAIGALGAAVFGWGAAKIAGAAGLNYLGAELAVGLLPLTGDGLPASALLWFLAGGMSGAIFGALAGLLVDLFGRITRLTS